MIANKLFYTEHRHVFEKM